jgi:hypothetical protein
MVVLPMTEMRPRQLAPRSAYGIEVTLLWHPATDVRVCVSDRQRGTSFEVVPNRSETLDVYYHPHAYTSAGPVHDESDRFAA